MIRWILVCSIAALIGVLLAKCVFGQGLVWPTPFYPMSQIPKAQPVFSERNYDIVKIENQTYGHWATLYWRSDVEARNPETTYITSTWHPYAVEVAPHRWTVVFTRD